MARIYFAAKGSHSMRQSLLNCLANVTLGKKLAFLLPVRLMPIGFHHRLSARAAVLLVVAGLIPALFALETRRIDARLAADGRSFMMTAAGFEEFRATWSATFKRDSAPERVLASTEGIVTPGAVTTIRFPEESIELLFQLESRTDAPAIMVRAGIRNTGTAPVSLLSATAVAAEWKLPANLNGWMLTGFHPATPVVQALRFIDKPLQVHEYGGCFHADGAGFLFGPVGDPTADLDSLWVKVGDHRMSFQCKAEMSGVRVDPGETRWGQQVVLLVENSRDALPRWAGWTGKSHHARAESPALTGWGTWYSFGDRVSGEDVLAVVETVRKKPDRLRPDVILTDKGHGETERFPEGQAFYSRTIAATGARPGLKLEFNGKVDPYAYIRQVVRDGVRFVKLGDIRGPGEIRNPKETDFEMRRRQYAAAREAAGPDTYLLNCRLFLDRASVGYVDASRTGRMAWNNQVLPAIKEVLRSYHLNGRWFAIDNDHFYLGTDTTNVSRIGGGWPVARTWMSMVGMSCGAAFASDPLNLSEVKPFWRNLEVMTPPAREQTEVIDLGIYWHWPRLVGQVHREWGDATVALLWNPEEDESIIKLDFASAGMDGNQRYAVWSFWENRYLGLAQEFWNTPRLAPSASQHLRFTPIPAAFKPVLIGSNLHIYCGAAEIKTIRSTRSSMAIELNDAGARAGDLFVYSHYLPVLRSASGLVISNIDQAGENVWRIRMRDRKHGAVQRIELSILLPVTLQWWFWMLIALVITGFLTTVWRYMVSLRLQRRLALDQERSRISRDLHDGMGADLTQIALIAEMAARQPGLLPAAREQLDRIVSSTHDLAGELDSVVWATNPGNDTLEHLVQYLEHHAQSFLEIAGIRLRLDIPPELPDLTIGSSARHNIFLAVKEALNNIVRHAEASLVHLRLRVSEHSLELDIEDDGRGIGTRTTGDPCADGVANMSKRMALIQGRSESLPGKNGHGTLVRFRVPLGALDSPPRP